MRNNLFFTSMASKKLTRLIITLMMMLFWSASERLLAQKISLDRAEVVELTKLAEKSSFLIGENRSLKVQLANAKDTVIARDKTISGLLSTITSLKQKNQSLSNELDEKSAILKKIYWAAGIIALGFLGLKIYNFFS